MTTRRLATWIVDLEVVDESQQVLVHVTVVDRDSETQYHAYAFPRGDDKWVDADARTEFASPLDQAINNVCSMIEGRG